MGYRVLYLAIQGRLWGGDGNGEEGMGIKGKWGKGRGMGRYVMSGEVTLF